MRCSACRCRRGAVGAVRILVEEGVSKDEADVEGWTALIVAAQNNLLVVIQYLLEQGADKDKVHTNGFSPLYIAAANGHFAVVQCLVDNIGIHSALQLIRTLARSPVFTGAWS